MITNITVKESGDFKAGDHVWISEHRTYGDCAETIGVLIQLASLSDEEIIQCITCGSLKVKMDRSAAAKK